MWNDRYRDWSLWGRAAFDPFTLLAGTAAVAAEAGVGTGLAGLAGGAAAGVAGGAAGTGIGLGTVGMGLTGAGGLLSAGGTIAGGNYAKTAGQMQKAAADFQAGQIEQNATQAIASGQRSMFDSQLKTKLALSTSRANAAASGGSADVGSPLENEGQIAQRGEYHALMDMFNGESTATGLRNQAAGVRYSGDLAELEGVQKQRASYLAAGGTLAGSLGTGLSTYGKFAYPTARGNFGS